MEPILSKDIKRIYTLLGLTKLLWQKEDLAKSYSKGRTIHISNLTFTEATSLIQYLMDQCQDNDKAERNRSNDLMRRKILSYAYEMQWADPGDWRNAMKVINAFCMGKHGIFKKPLSDHTSKELANVVTQFGELYTKYLRVH